MCRFRCCSLLVRNKFEIVVGHNCRTAAKILDVELFEDGGAVVNFPSAESCIVSGGGGVF